MKIINKYLLKQLKMPVTFGISLFTFIFLIELMVKMMEFVLIKKVPALDVLHLLTYYIPAILAQTIPMGYFLGVMITYNKLSSTSESVALVSMGMNLNKILKVPFLMSIGIFFFIIFLQEKLIPESFIRAQNLAIKIGTETPAFQLTEKTFMENIGDYSIYIDKLENKKNAAKNVVIFQKSKKDKYPNILLAERVVWQDGAMRMENGRFHKFDKDGKEEVTGHFDRQIYPLTSFLSEVEVSIKEIETMSIFMLIEKIRKLEREGKDEKEALPYKVELQRKLAAPFASIFLGVLGVLFSLGHHRTGKNVGYGLSLLVIFLYITLFNVGIVLAKKGMVNHILILWLPNLILATLTGILYYRKVKKG